MTMELSPLFQHTLTCAIIALSFFQVVMMFREHGRSHADVQSVIIEKEYYPCMTEVVEGPSMTPVWGEFIMRLGGSPYTRIICEIGYNDRYPTSIWLRTNPMTSVYRFGSAQDITDSDRWATANPTLRSRLHTFPFDSMEEVLRNIGGIFHCDMISISNASTFRKSAVVSAFKRLHAYSDAQTLIMSLGICMACPDNAITKEHELNKAVWDALTTEKLVQNDLCQTTARLEGWCAGNSAPPPEQESKRSKNIPLIDVATVTELRKRALRNNNTIYLTVVNEGFEDMFKNYECSLRRLGIDNVLYQLMDPPSVHLLRFINAANEDNGQPLSLLAFYDPNRVQSGERSFYKSKNFIAMMRLRFSLQAELLLMGFHVMLSDADTSYALDPFANGYIDYSVDVTAQADVLEVMDLEDSTGVSPNGGFFLTKSTYGGLRLVSYMQNTWSQKSKISENYDDQDALWDAFLKLGCYEGDFDIYGCPQSSVFTFKLLDTVNFPSGHQLSAREQTRFLRKVKPNRPVVVFHANSAEGKQAKMQFLKVWYHNSSEPNPTRWCLR